MTNNVTQFPTKDTQAKEDTALVMMCEQCGCYTLMLHITGAVSCPLCGPLDSAFEAEPPLKTAPNAWKKPVSRLQVADNDYYTSVDATFNGIPKDEIVAAIFFRDDGSIKIWDNVATVEQFDWLLNKVEMAKEVFVDERKSVAKQDRQED